MQWIIDTNHLTWHIGKHTIFGRVSDGMNVVKRMGLVPTDKNDRYVYRWSIFFNAIVIIMMMMMIRPKDPVRIIRARVEE